MNSIARSGAPAPDLSEGTASARRILATVALATMVTTAQAQTYAGAGFGAGSTIAPSVTGFHPSLSVERDQNTPVGTLFLGHRAGWWGVEGGAFTLPSYRARVRTDDYRGYKGAAASPADPFTADVMQRIDGRAFYLRFNAYAPQVMGFTPYAFAGLANATSRNREEALYDGSERASNDQTFANRAALYGLGLQREAGGVTLRLEWLTSPGLQDNPHTLRRDVSMVTLAAAWEFRP